MKAVAFRLINLNARHVENEHDEGQAQLLGTRDCLVDRISKEFHFFLFGHRYIPVERLDMTNLNLDELLGSKEESAVPPETMDGLRLLKMFLKLTPAQRREILELVERRLQH